jgi:membrane protein
MARGLSAAHGAALSYYAAYSIAPLLILAIVIAGLAFGHDTARGKIVDQ